MASNKITVTVGITKDIIEVCHQLMQERDNLQTHLDLSAQAIDAVTAERDEARAWARRMKRERDALRDLLGMMDVDKIAENLEKMRRWLK
jgi:hypothetical protein